METQEAYVHVQAMELFKQNMYIIEYKKYQYGPQSKEKEMTGYSK